MHESVMKFLQDNLRSKEIRGKDVLEVGSQDINGTPRDIILRYGPASYIGVDSGAGPGVDVVLDVRNLTAHFGSKRFDLVVSTEMLEHAEDWKAAVTQMKEILRLGGLLAVSTRGPGFPYHGFPHDYWRFTVEDFKAIFSDMAILVCAPDQVPGVFLTARKTDKTGTTDLSKISVAAVKPW